MNQAQNQSNALDTSRIVWWAVITAGSLYYLRQYLVNCALWADEARLALNLVDRNFIGLTQPLDYHQAAPVGFLWVVKFLISLLGSTEYVFRLLPLLAGIGSLYIIYRFAREYFGFAGLVAVVLFASNTWLNAYFSEFKQYGVDVFITLLLIHLSMKCFGETVDRKHFIILGLAGVICVWFSHTSIFVLAGIGIALVVERLTRNTQTPFSWLMVLGAVWLASFGLHYLLILKYTAVDEYFRTYWHKTFLPLPPWGNLGWYLKTYYIFLLILLNRTDLILVYLTPLMAVFGLISLLIRNRALALVLFLPFPIVLIASALQQYPLSYRFMLFMIPLVSLLIAEATSLLYRLVSKWRSDIAMVIAVIPFLIMLWYTFPFTVQRFFSPILTSDIRPLIEYVEKNRQSNDIVYVYYGSTPAFNFYSRRYGLTSGNIIIPPFEDRRRVALHHFYEDVEGLQGNQRVWFLFSDIIYCEDCAGDKRVFFKGALSTYGTLLDQMESPGEAGVYLYDLNP